MAALRLPMAMRWLLALLSVVFGWFVGVYDSIPSYLLLLLLLLLLGASYLGPAPYRPHYQFSAAKSTGESCEWLNDLLRCWWKEKQGVLFNLTKEHVEPVLNQLKPHFIESVELIEIDFGDFSPKFDAISTTLERNGTGLMTGRVVSSFKQITNQKRVTISANMIWNCSHSNIALRVRLGGKNLGVNTVVKVESFNISGPVELTISSSPLLSTLSISFLHQPEYWFSINALHFINITKIPLVKSWLYSTINRTIHRLMVAPGKLDIDLSPKIHEITPKPAGPAVGVLTVTLFGSSGSLTQSNCYCIVRVEKQKHRSSFIQGKSPWTVTHSFLIHDTKSEKVLFEVKSKCLGWSQILAFHCISLAELKLDDSMQENKKIRRKIPSSFCDIEFQLEYTNLGPLDINRMTSPLAFSLPQASSGVLSLLLHSGKDLPYSHTDSCQFYSCAVIAEKRLAMLSDDAISGVSVVWNSQRDFLTADYTCTVTLILCGKRHSAAQLEPLACTVMTIMKGECFVKKRVLQLHLLSSDSSPAGTITVSLAFRPVESVKDSELALEKQMADESIRELMLHKSWRLLGKSTDRYATFVSTQSSQKSTEIEGLIDITVHQARDLVPRTTGLGDPYVEIKLNHQRLFETKCIQNSTHPVWEESVTIEMLQPGATLVLECWDRQLLQDESLGSIQLTLDHIKMYQDSPSEWFTLKGCASGKLQLSLKMASTSESSPSTPSVSRRPLAISTPFIMRHSSDSEEEDGRTGSWPTISREGSLRERKNAKVQHVFGHKESLLLRSTSVGPAWPGNRPAFDRRSSVASSCSSKQTNMFYGMSGTVLQAAGLKGEIEKLKLYVKVRLNSRPSSQRHHLHKYSRGPVIYKTRGIKGSKNPEWMETFQVRESGVACDSLLTVDLKSDSHIRIGTQTITLEKFFEGQNQTRKWLDIGNDVKLELLLSCQSSPLPSPTPKLKKQSLSFRKSKV